MNLSRNSGYLLIATGVIHNLVGFFIGKDVLLEILTSGVINSINTEMDRNAIFWFLFSGFMMIILGKLMQDYSKHFNKALPVSLGHYLLALTIVGCIMMPISGFWIVLPQAVLIIVGGKKAVVTTN
jgi:hypothetical protein